MLVDLTHHPWPLLLQVPVRLVVTGGLKKACPDVTEVKLDLNGDAGYAQRKIAKTANLEDREVGGLSIRHVGLNKMLDTAPESLASIGDIGVDGTTLLEVRHAGADRKAAEDCFKKLNACPLIVQNLSGDNSQLLSEWQTSTDLARDFERAHPKSDLFAEEIMLVANAAPEGFNTHAEVCEYVIKPAVARWVQEGDLTAELDPAAVMCALAFRDKTAVPVTFVGDFEHGTPEVPSITLVVDHDGATVGYARRRLSKALNIPQKNLRIKVGGAPRRDRATLASLGIKPGDESLALVVSQRSSSGCHLA